MRFRMLGLAAFLVISLAMSAEAQELSLQLGHEMRVFSTRSYHNYRAAGLGLAFDRLCSPFGKSRFGVELRLGYLFGNDIRVVCDQLPKGHPGCSNGLDEGGTIDLDHWMVGILPLWRRPIGKRWELEAGVGMAWTEPKIIETGTVWQFMFMGGLRYRPPWTNRLTLGIRFEHISNGGAFGFTNNEVIGLESVNLVLAWRFVRIPDTDLI